MGIAAGDRAALVTGASSGIGRDIARELAARGYHLVLVARRRDRLAELANELRQQYGIECEVLDADLADRARLNGLMARVVSWVTARRLTLTLLVNNAGSGLWEWFEKQPRDIVQRDIDLNVTALTTLTHDFIAVAKAHGRPAQVMNVASLVALLPAPRYTVYGGTKAYVRQFSDVLRYELRHTNIGVTCVCPGGVKTEFVALAGQELKGDTGMMESPEVARLAVDATLRGDVLYIPGALNRLSALVRFLPRWLRLPIVEKSMLITVQEK
ncbi:MAG: SDR family NAD(P)-dependent oxidoreductase [Pseudomonadota bacterium]